jgi:hypothetical protein
MNDFERIRKIDEQMAMFSQDWTLAEAKEVKVKINAAQRAVGWGMLGLFG